MITDLYDTTADELIRNKDVLSIVFFCDRVLLQKIIKTICYKLLTVLEYIHQQEIVHWYKKVVAFTSSDVKPSNILYREGNVALGDWGR